MYQIVQKLDGKILCIGQLQDGKEVWEEEALASAIISMKNFASIMNGVEITKADINIIQQKRVEIKIQNRQKLVPPRYTPDEKEEKDIDLRCEVCLNKVNYKGSKYGSRCWASAMAGYKSNYVEYMCPNYKEIWHKQVIELKKESKKTNSKKIRDILEQEIKEILDTCEATITKTY